MVADDKKVLQVPAGSSGVTPAADTVGPSGESPYTGIFVPYNNRNFSQTHTFVPPLGYSVDATAKMRNLQTSITPSLSSGASKSSNSENSGAGSGAEVNLPMSRQEMMCFISDMNRLAEGVEALSQKAQQAGRLESLLSETFAALVSGEMKFGVHLMKCLVDMKSGSGQYDESTKNSAYTNVPKWMEDAKNSGQSLVCNQSLPDIPDSPIVSMSSHSNLSLPANWRETAAEGGADEEEDDGRPRDGLVVDDEMEEAAVKPIQEEHQRELASKLDSTLACLQNTQRAPRKTEYPPGSKRRPSTSPDSNNGESTSSMPSLDKSHHEHKRASTSKSASGNSNDSDASVIKENASPFPPAVGKRSVFHETNSSNSGSTTSVAPLSSRTSNGSYPSVMSPQQIIEAVQAAHAHIAPHLRESFSKSSSGSGSGSGSGSARDSGVTNDGSSGRLQPSSNLMDCDNNGALLSGASSGEKSSGDGNGVLTMDSEGPPADRASRRRERNRIAAKKSRQKRAQFMNELQDMTKNMESENSNLKSLLGLFLRENASLKKFIENHSQFLPSNSVMNYIKQQEEVRKCWNDISNTEAVEAADVAADSTPNQTPYYQSVAPSDPQLRPGSADQFATYTNQQMYDQAGSSNPGPRSWNN